MLQTAGGPLATLVKRLEERELNGSEAFSSWTTAAMRRLALVFQGPLPRRWSRCYWCWRWHWQICARTRGIRVREHFTQPFFERCRERYRNGGLPPWYPNHVQRCELLVRGISEQERVTTRLPQRVCDHIASFSGRAVAAIGRPVV